MEKYFIILTIFLFSAPYLVAQEATSDHDFLFLPDSNEVIVNDVPNTKKQVSKTHVNWNAGMNFGYSPNRYLSSGMYVNPNVSYQPADRLTLNVGVGFQYTTLYPVGEFEQAYGSSIPVTGLFVTAQGAYQVSPRLTVSGTAYHEKNDVPNLNKKNNPYASNDLDLDRTGVSVGFTYKITPTMTIGLQVGIQEGPSRYSPYGFGSPYNDSYGYPHRFGSPNSWW